MLWQSSFWKRASENSTNLILGFLVLLFSCSHFIGFSQAVLPTSRTSWLHSAHPTGWTHTATSQRTSTSACTGSDGVIFDNTGDRIVLFMDSDPDILTFKLKKQSMSGESFMTVERSNDGSSWTSIGVYGTATGATAITDCGDISLALPCGTRYVRWTYTKATGNCDMDDVSVTKNASCTPCSGCSIDNGGLSSVSCNNNGTSGDTSDDIITFSLNPSGCDLSATYTVSVSGGAATSISPASASYGSATNFTLNTGSAGGGNLTVTITDASGASCFIDVIVADPGVCSVTSSGGTNEPGIVVNEYSNGSSGSKEYVELLVVGAPCTTVDLRGWIIDDNNGFDNATCEGFAIDDCASGIAAGHARFANIARWSAVPVGSLILLYNSADKNATITLADDPADSNGDLVYVVPITDSGLESSLIIPSAPQNCGTGSYTSGNCNYTPVTYSTSTSWSPISLNNTSDAFQTRKPDGTFFHGMSYGTSNMTGGPDGINFNTTGTGKVFYLNCGHHSFLSDYSYNDVAGFETPGSPNNSLNQELVDYYRGVGGCGVTPPCVVLLSSKNLVLKGKSKKGDNELMWRVDDEVGVVSYTIQRSADNINFESIGSVKSYGAVRYIFTDKNPNKVNYYRIISTLETTKHISNTIALSNSENQGFSVNNLIPNPANNSFSFDFELKNRGSEVQFVMYNMLGAIVEEQLFTRSQSINIESSHFENGLYYLVFSNGSEQQSHKLLIQH